MAIEKSEYKILKEKLDVLQQENIFLKKEINCLKGVSSEVQGNGFDSQMLKQLLDTLPDSIYFKDRHSRFLYASRKLCQLCNCADCNEIIGKTDFDFFAIEHAQQAFNDEQTIIKTGKPLFNKIEKETWPDGSETYVTTSKLPLLDKNGDVIGTYGLSKDITQQVKAEQELKKLTEELEKLVEKRTLELTRSEQKYRLLAETSTDIILQVDINGLISYCSPSVFEILGYNSEELVMKPFGNLVSPESKTNVDQILTKTMQGNQSLITVAQFLNKNLDKSWIEINSTPLVIEDKTVGVLAIARDVNKRIQTEEQNAKLIHAVENSPVSIVVTNTDGNIEYVNKKFQDLTGYSAEEAKGQNPRILKSGKTPEEVYKVLWDSLVIGGSWSGELINKKKSGELYWEQAQISAIRTTGNKVTHYIAVKEDITQRKKSEELLEKSNQRLRAITSIIQSETNSIQELLELALEKAIEITESKIGYIYYFNEEKQEFQLNSWSKQVMNECSIADPQRSYLLEKTGIWGEAVRQRKPIILNDFQTSHPLKKGYPEGHAHLSKFLTVPVFDATKIVAVVGVANKTDNYTEADILQLTLLMDAVWQQTRRKQMEIELRQKNSELIESNAQKDKFFSIIAHDLRSPFSGIAGLSNYIVNNYHQLNENERIESIQLIDNAAKGIWGLLENLLDWSRSMLGKMEFKPKVLEIQSIINGNRDFLDQAAASKKIEIRYDGDMAITLFADSNMLKTILRNLISNAIKFTRENGQIVVKIDQTSLQTLFVVADNGIGMDEQTISQLFNINKSITNLGTSGEKGTGLGLLLCKEMVEKHNGKIWVESEPGKGSKFMFTLPKEKKK
jgi:PAS domain S-box-containing protein